MPSDSLLEIEDLETHFFLDEGVLRAVDGVSLKIDRHKTVGIIGESGCGKTVMAQSVLQIVPPPGKLVAGRILLHANGGSAPVDLASFDPVGEEIRQIRGAVVSMVFQEPMTSLSPVHTVGDQVSEMILQHLTKDKQEAAERTAALLDTVGMPDAKRRMASYPHELSGGLRQRVVIAMALACNPMLLIADEPTTALDVTVQAQILELLTKLQDQFGMAIMFITHDLGIIAGIADEVAVMYLGRIVERGPVKEIFRNPRHPYTVGLLNSIPKLGRGKAQRLESIEGTVPLPIDLPPQCGFVSRCTKAVAGQCDRRVPPLVEVEENHFVRCVLFEEEAASR
jgi:peptide/nickel transport system ATP-binding protein